MYSLSDLILVVDDIPNILELLEVTLSFNGYPVITATNGIEALDLTRTHHPALVITDILMPKMDGYSLVYHLRKDLETCQIPIIFLSATYLTPEDKEFAMSLGAARFLEKPVDTEEFLLTVAEVLGSQPQSMPLPISELDFLTGYHQRLEVKMHHKKVQILRTERLLETIPENQRSAFLELLGDSQNQLNQIQLELDAIHNKLSILAQAS
jgi:CheY-like chemotaxis protein